MVRRDRGSTRHLHRVLPIWPSRPRPHPPLIAERLVARVRETGEDAVWRYSHGIMSPLAAYLDHVPTAAQRAEEAYAVLQEVNDDPR